MLITLPADPSSNLDWEIDPNTKGIWLLDFGWKTINLFDTAAFNSYMLVIEEFAKRYPQSKKVVLAQINGKFSKLIFSSEIIEQHSEGSGLDQELILAQLFSEYLHRLASALPDDAEPAIMVDISIEECLSEKILLFSKRRFEHFQLIFPNISLPIEGDANIIISLPQDRKYKAARFTKLIQILKGMAFKCIPEELLNEHWEGVDYLIVDPELVGDNGKRMLHGFEAAGGHIVSTGDLLGFANEMTIEEFLNKFNNQKL